jgi:hypothetical protein
MELDAGMVVLYVCMYVCVYHLQAQDPLMSEAGSTQGSGMCRQVPVDHALYIMYNICYLC